MGSDRSAERADIELEREGLNSLTVEWATAAAARISPAWLNFRDAVMEQRLTHDGDHRLARHVGNMTIKSDRLGPRPIRDRNSPRSFIDTGIAAVMAHDRSRASDERPRRKPSRYRDTDMKDKARGGRDCLVVFRACAWH